MDFMSNLKSTLNNECNVSITENGAVGYRTTGKALLDLNFSVASLRRASEKDIFNRFTKAFFEDKVLAMKWLFYARDVRGASVKEDCFVPVWFLWRRTFPSMLLPLFR